MTTIQTGVLTAATARIFTAAGICAVAAHQVAEALVEADARGISSHGVLLVPMYVDRLLAGSVGNHTEADLVLDAGAVAVLDAGHALGILTADQAMRLAVTKAAALGIGVVSVRRAFHFGGAFRYVQAAMAAGQIGIAAANTRPLMPAPGGASAVLGNNPIAIGVPGPDPVLVDMALSEAALGKIRLAESEGRAIPPTWATDRDGLPTTDPVAALAGLLLPAGGPKGYGLALVIDVLTGVLSGGSFGAGVKGLYADPAVPNDCAHLFLALDPEAFGAADLPERTARLAREVRDSRLAPGVDRVLLPGEREAAAARIAHRDGVRVPESVLTALADTARRVGAQLPAELNGDNGKGQR
ncbi:MULTISPECIES: Ldh family oxidoreductase [unclassified Crossiella]|uniref:Ldh family oxidoreductase n=1 Tax=unclassified Crossiella TaxID=2620835 RepID=UPI001FFE655B|nr:MULTISPECIES: Ldh family oxidoreductase [unclassified Crossiella]MCK2244666.1 Ldh family oxidoreductase [Crossiella sp. S99.2]MCK2258347.1 Ldh family oxidoreductase [Crossiella sp. S99.1]